MNAPPFPLNPVVGQRFGNWIWDGNRWVRIATGGIQVVMQTFGLDRYGNVASGQFPYMPSPGLVTAVVELVGGGGGGGGALGGVVYGSGSGWCVGGGGGSAGTYVRSAIPAQLVRGGVIVTIGAGGTPGPATQATTGGRGGMSTFGGLMLAEGGFGGGSNVIAGGTLDPAFGQGADPGTVNPPEGPNNIGDLSTWGGAGTSGGTTYYNTDVELSQTIAWGGQGGNSFFAGTWAGQIQSAGGAPGRDGHMAGAGGSGGASAYTTQPSLGGAGAPGLCVVTEYCWGDMGDDCLNPPLEVNARVAVTHVPWRGPGPCPPGWGEQIDYDGD